MLELTKENMSKSQKEKSSSEEKSSDEDTKDYHLHLSRFLSKSDDSDDIYHDSTEAESSQGENMLSFSEKMPLTSVLRARGPGRPRIHPLKPLGVSRPRGRPKGSRNKKPRKRLEKPPKRPRGRPRKWPPEMWEGFQRSRHTVLRRNHDRLHPQQEIPGTSHLYMDQSDNSGAVLHSFPPAMHPQQHHVHHPHFHSSSARPQMSHYVQTPIETNPSPGLPLLLQQRPPVEITRPPLMPSVLPTDVAHHSQEDPPEMLWMHHMPPDDQHPPSTTH